jgi:UDP-glucose 4-epimerase
MVVLDNLVRGHRQELDTGVPFYQGDVGNRVLLAQIAQAHERDSCIHRRAN